MAYNKVIYGGNIIMDISGDTVTAESLLSGFTAHGADGEAISGICAFDANTSDATANDGEILAGKTAYKDGSKLTGTMTDRGAVTGTISTKAGQYTVPAGYHNGSGKVSISAAEQSKIISGNIKNGVTILGVLGTYSGEGSTVQQKEVTPSVDQQTVAPDVGYDYLSAVTVKAIPYRETALAGGTMVEIAY